jgi:hypothetical protein
MWGKAHIEATKNPDNRNPKFLQEIHMFIASDINISGDDFKRISDYLNMSLHEQHKIQSAKFAYLENREQDSIFRSIRPMFASYYDFVFPATYQQAMKEWKLKRIKDKQTHKARDKEFYTITKSDIATILETSTKVMEVGGIRNKTEYFKAVNAVQMISGRRTIEVVKLLEYKPAEHVFQVKVKGLAKQGGFPSSDDEFITIPLLCEFYLFKRKMDEIRAFWDVSVMDNKAVDHLIGQNIRRWSKKMFGRMLSHTQKRNIYSEIAWSTREKNGFQIGEDSCSKYVWVAKALGHEINYNAISTTQAYQVMNITE